jgi:virginiamycin B lyase
VTKGPDGNIWFTESDPDYIGKITPTRTITEYAVPTANGETWGITVGPDKELWFTNPTGWRMVSWLAVRTRVLAVLT